jgi:hypothetical protein
MSPAIWKLKNYTTERLVTLYFQKRWWLMIKSFIATYQNAMHYF